MERPGYSASKLISQSTQMRNKAWNGACLTPSPGAIVA
jgi:hypothetical protein